MKVRLVGRFFAAKRRQAVAGHAGMKVRLVGRFFAAKRRQAVAGG